MKPMMKPQSRRAPMMADGGIAPPDPIGGAGMMPPPPPAPAPMAGDPDMDGDMDSPGIRPEAVNYHDDAQSCSGCMHFSDGNCAVLKMQVSPDGGCTAFEAGGGMATDDEAMVGDEGDGGDMALEDDDSDVDY